MGIFQNLLYRFLLPPPRMFQWAGIIFFLLLLCTASCNTVDPPPDKTVLTLTLEDVSCTEAWITLTTANLQLPISLNLLKDNTITKTINLQTADTLLYIDSLLPNQTYKFYSVIQPINHSSNEISVTTMDTTSHDFTWQTWTFGGTAGSSTLYDVAIVNESCIWAVGEIYIADTSANGYTMYNAVHWDGNEWTLKRITVDFRGFQITPPLEGAFAFSSTDVWFVGSLPIHGDGENWVMYDLRTTVDPNISLSKAWGTSSSDIYFIGNLGSIAYYNGQSFSKIESGTNTIINDVWGINNDNNETIAYAPVSSFFTPGDKKILRIKNNLVDSVSWNMNRLLYSAWTNKGRYLYVCGSGAFENKSGSWKEIALPQISMNRIRGNAINDIFIAGDFGFVTHFNGLSWTNYANLYDSNTAYYSLSIYGNNVLIVGWSNGKGIITVGRRN